MIENIYQDSLRKGFAYAELLCPLPFASENHQLLLQCAYVATWLHLGINPHPRMIPEDVFYVLRSGAFPRPCQWNWVDAVEFAVKVITDHP
jgi:hypothetical protein